MISGRHSGISSSTRCVVCILVPWFLFSFPRLLLSDTIITITITCFVVTFYVLSRRYVHLRLEMSRIILAVYLLSIIIYIVILHSRLVIPNSPKPTHCVCIISQDCGCFVKRHYGDGAIISQWELDRVAN